MHYDAWKYGRICEGNWSSGWLCFVCFEVGIPETSKHTKQSHPGDQITSPRDNMLTHLQDNKLKYSLSRGFQL